MTGIRPAAIASKPRSPAPNNETASRIAGLVIGHRDLEADAVSVREHGKGNFGAKPRTEAIANLLTAICERRT